MYVLVTGERVDQKTKIAVDRSLSKEVCIASYAIQWNPISQDALWLDRPRVELSRTVEEFQVL